MKYSFKYCSNTSFHIVPATESAGYEIKELREIYKTHLLTELEQLESFSDDDFIKYFDGNLERFR